MAIASSVSMRENYATHGVSTYYTHVGESYRNRHFPEVCKSMAAALDVLAGRLDRDLFGMVTSDQIPAFRLLDVACGAGEATLAFAAWMKAAKSRSTLLPEFKLSAIAADPYTREAFLSNTGLPERCFRPWSFADIAAGCILDHCSDASDRSDHHKQPQFDLIVSSFALHLLDEAHDNNDCGSSLYSTLYQLSLVGRWLMVVTPHKKPEVTRDMGWELAEEVVRDRVRTRIYRSLYF
ncbi:hypothetical protein RI367_006297 [Sorochytrium milnesiophthora]